jgi:ribosomal RNA-processing protein 36
MDSSEISFGQLLNIKQTVGSKTFHQSFHPSKQETQTQKPKPVSSKPKKTKNGPVEITSKKPTTRKRMILNTLTKSRDPRFDSLSGKYNPELFERSYGFIGEIQKNELIQQKNILKDNKGEFSEEELQNLKKKTDIMSSRLALSERTKLQQIEKNQWKKKEASLISNGKKPYFMKNSQMKTQMLIKKFKEIPLNMIDKVLEKKRKRNATKQQVKIPSKRRSEL